MPIIIPKKIPAFEVLSKENIFVMAEKRAINQDIRPIEIAVLNLMPTKIETETQLMRLLSNSPLQVNITLLNTKSYQSKNTSKTHLDRFYKSFDDIKFRRFDGMIITGAPVETMKFEDVDYWQELSEILDYAKEYVTSTLFICWGAQAALYKYYGIDKCTMDKKLFGVYPHRAVVEFDPLLKGMDDVFYIPHSRYTSSVGAQIDRCKELIKLAVSEQAGPSVIKSKDNRLFFFSGHSEYDRETLNNEYLRDKSKGIDISPPCNYFTDETHSNINMKWKAAANLLFSNWLNYYVYQVTPYDISSINGVKP